MDQKVITLSISKIDKENNHINDVNEQPCNHKRFLYKLQNNEPNKWVKCGDYKNRRETIKFPQTKFMVSQ